MGTSSSFGEVARKLNQAAKNIEADMPKTILRAAEAAKGEIDSEIKRRVPDMEMSGLVRKGKSGKLKSGKVGTKLVKARRHGDEARAVRAVGAVHWLESGTRPHLVGAGRVNASRTTRSRYRKANATFLKGSAFGHPVRGPLAHPGMPAGHTWSKGIRAATPKATQQMAQHLPRAVLRPFIG